MMDHDESERGDAVRLTEDVYWIENHHGRPRFHGERVRNILNKEGLAPAIMACSAGGALVLAN